MVFLSRSSVNHRFGCTRLFPCNRWARNVTNDSPASASESIGFGLGHRAAPELRGGVFGWGNSPPPSTLSLPTAICCGRRSASSVSTGSPVYILVADELVIRVGAVLHMDERRHIHGMLESQPVKALEHLVRMTFRAGSCDEADDGAAMVDDGGRGSLSSSRAWREAASELSGFVREEGQRRIVIVHEAHQRGGRSRRHAQHLYPSPTKVREDLSLEARRASRRSRCPGAGRQPSSDLVPERRGLQHPTVAGFRTKPGAAAPTSRPCTSAGTSAT